MVKEECSSMKKLELIGLMALSILLLVGIVSASTPLIVGGGWTTYGVPAGKLPIHWDGAPFTYYSAVPTHFTYVDGACIGDVAAFYENGNQIGQGSPVVTESPHCAGIYNGDQALADGRFSNTCINMQPGEHSIDIYNVQSYNADESDGGFIRVDEGSCPGVTPAPEFPTIFLPVTFIIGFLGAVMLVQRTREY
jgi:hypothetical protein